MKTKLILAASLIGLATLSARAGDLNVGVRIGVPVPPPPVVVVSPPAPVVVVPDSYVWDGYEYVGYANGSYLYLSGDVWLPLGGERIGRFHEWERGHPDWHSHAIRNEHFRGHEDHDRDHGHDHHHD